MPRFEYKSDILWFNDLQSFLSNNGEEGWRLHTCEPIVPVGPYGSGMEKILVVMDRAIYDESKEVSDDSSQGMAMRG